MTEEETQQPESTDDTGEPNAPDALALLSQLYSGSPEEKIAAAKTLGAFGPSEMADVIGRLQQLDTDPMDLGGKQT